MSRFQFLEKYAVDGVHYDSAKELDKLSNSKWSSDVRDAVSHPKATPEMLEKHSTSKFDWVRKAIAKNPSTPHHVLDKLADDHDYEVREGVVRNEKIHPELLDKLVNRKEKDMDGYIKSALLSNPNVTSDHVTTLMKTVIKNKGIGDFGTFATHPKADNEFIKSIPKEHPEFYHAMKSWYPNTVKKIFGEQQ